MSIYREIEKAIEKIVNRKAPRRETDVEKKVDGQKMKAAYEKRNLQGKKETTLYEFIIEHIKKLDNCDELYRKNGELNEAEFYRLADIDDSTWSGIRLDEIVPGKKTLLKLVMALRLNEEDAYELMRKGLSGFSMKDKRDLVILALIDLKKYDREIVYDVLNYYGSDPECSFENIYDSAV